VTDERIAEFMASWHKAKNYTCGVDCVVGEDETDDIYLSEWMKSQHNQVGVLLGEVIRLKAESKMNLTRTAINGLEEIGVLREKLTKTKECVDLARQYMSGIDAPSKICTFAEARQYREKFLQKVKELT